MNPFIESLVGRIVADDELLDRAVRHVVENHTLWGLTEQIINEGGV